MAALSALKTTLNAVVPGLPLGDILLGNIGSFKKGFVFEVIDSRSGEALMTKSLVLNPRRYTITEPFAVTLTPTEDDTVVAEENGMIVREIVLEGTTGLRKRKEEALGRGGSIGTEASGPDHFHELRNVFRDYSNLKKNPEDSPFIQMVFHNVKEDEHFVVVPRAFETPRDAASTRMHYNYRITLAAIQQLPLPPPPASGLFGKVVDAIKDANEAMHDARALLVEAIDLVEIYRERVRNPERFLEQAAFSINAVHDFVDNVTITIALSREFHAAVGDLIEDVEEQLGNDIDGEPTEAQVQALRKASGMRKALERIMQHSQLYEPPIASDTARAYAGDRNLTDADLENGTAGAEKGTRTRLALGSERSAGLDLGSFSGSKRNQIGAGDTIDTLAIKFNVPREALIELNNLRYPFITRGGGPGTLQPGDSILIPTRGGGAQTSPSPIDRYLTPEEIVYGSDIALDAELLELGVFDIAVDEAHGSLDAEQIRGVPNVVQGMGILLGTERGSTDYIPDLGVRRTPGVKGTVANMLLASLYLREAILSDTRVVGINSTRIVLEGDKLVQEITPQLIGSREGVAVRVPFGKASR